MKEATVTADNGRAPRGVQESRGVAGPRPTPSEGVSVGPELLLRRLALAIESELPPRLREGVDPLLTEVRQGVAALYPGPDRAPLTPKKRQEEREQLGQTLDTLEEVLEALQVAAHHLQGKG
ncbi:hypothetical protein [Archangium lansingense]|uniref:Uncharacterized protein n=1 Tax=Archangium lansingense TaxID=2995310 RepID=A0ABT4A195_9BACT|nr:hypothetical protein [Archangium lansinium]MCY1075141.1 hypothetical protein [Archangium lansinium]